MNNGDGDVDVDVSVVRISIRFSKRQLLLLKGCEFEMTSNVIQLPSFRFSKLFATLRKSPLGLKSWRGLIQNKKLSLLTSIPFIISIDFAFIILRTSNSCKLND